MNPNDNIFHVIRSRSNCIISLERSGYPVLINNKKKGSKQLFHTWGALPLHSAEVWGFTSTYYTIGSRTTVISFSTYPNTQCILKRPSVTFNRHGIGKRIDIRIVYREKVIFVLIFLPTIDDITYSTSLEHKTCINSYIQSGSEMALILKQMTIYSKGQ